MKVTPVKGTNDYLPKEVEIRDYLQQKILEVYLANGFEHIITHPCGASGPRGGHTVAGVGDHGGTSLFFALCGRFSFKDTKPYETPERRLKWRIAADQREALPKGEVFVLT